MKFDVSTFMMLGFLFFLAISLWKVYAFLPNKQLADDDNTKESIEKLTCIMIEVLKDSDNPPTHQELLVMMQEHEEFDKEHFWRFNENKLHNLLRRYYVLNEVSSIYEIHTQLQKTDA